MVEVNTLSASDNTDPNGFLIYFCPSVFIVLSNAANFCTLGTLVIAVSNAVAVSKPFPALTKALVAPIILKTLDQARPPPKDPILYPKFLNTLSPQKFAVSKLSLDKNSASLSFCV